MKDSVDRLVTSMRNSQLLRLFVIAFLALLLQIPVSMISGLVRERQQRNDAAVAEVSAKWGEAQSITGPALVVPYTHRWIDGVGGRPTTRTEKRNAIVPPEQLTMRGTMKSEVRRRGTTGSRRSVPVAGSCGSNPGAGGPQPRAAGSPRSLAGPGAARIDFAPSGGLAEWLLQRS